MSLSTHSISHSATPDEVLAGNRRSQQGGQATESRDAVFRLPEGFDNRQPTRQDTILDAVNKEEKRTGRKEALQEESLRQNTVRQNVQRKEAVLDQSREEHFQTAADRSREQILDSESVREEVDTVETDVENPDAEEIIAETNEAKVLKAETTQNALQQNNIKSVDSKDLTSVSPTLGTTRALHNNMSAVAAEFPTVDQSLPANGSDARHTVSDKGTEQREFRGGNRQDARHQQGGQMAENKERELLQSTQRSTADAAPQTAAPAAAGAEGAQPFNLSSSTASQSSTTAVQVEIVTGIMRQIEQLRQSGKTAMQITMVLPEGQELKLNLRASKDHVHIQLESTDQEIYNAVYNGWADLTEQAAKKGIRLDAPSFIGGEPVVDSDDNILNASA